MAKRTARVGTTKDKTGVRIIRLTGNLTISRADEMKSMLLESLEGVEHIEIDLSSVEEADLACLQLLCSAHRTSKRLGKVLKLCDGASGSFKQAVRRAGYARSSGCVLDTDNQCMWKEERFRE
jgi:anti-anti-sigma regulatory factor